MTEICENQKISNIDKKLQIKNLLLENGILKEKIESIENEKIEILKLFEQKKNSFEELESENVLFKERFKYYYERNMDLELEKENLEKDNL